LKKNNFEKWLQIFRCLTKTYIFDKNTLEGKHLTKRRYKNGRTLSGLVKTFYRLGKFGFLVKIWIFGQNLDFWSKFLFFITHKL